MLMFRKLIRQAFGDKRPGLDRLAALCTERRPRCRVARSLGFFEAVINHDGDALRRLAFERDNFSASRQICSASRFDHFPDFWKIGSLCWLVETLNFRDDIGFWRGLRVQPLNGCSADGSAGDESDNYLEIRFHDVLR